MASIIKVDTIQTAAGGTPTAADLGINTTGNLLQVVRNTYATQTALSTDAYTDTGLTATITPKSSTSTILVIAVMQYRLECTTTGQDVGIGFKILRGSTSIYTSATTYSNYIYYPGLSSYNFRSNSTYTAEDTSHGSTSELTYKVQMGGYNASSGNTTVDTQNGGNASSLLLIEIAG